MKGLHAQTVEVLGHRIVSGTYAPGHIINPDALTSELGVSRTVVREAFRVLAAKGLLGARQKLGTYVRPRPEWNLVDADVLEWLLGEPGSELLESLAEVREILEPAAARRAAVRRTEEHLERMQEALAEMGHGTPEAVADADLRFHHLIFEAAGNPLLLVLYRLVEPVVHARATRVFHGHHDDPIEVHSPLLAAIRSGDPDLAERASRQLLVIAIHDQENL
ncbi:FadR/GntR family transcriptional regulator [Nocardia sp. NPDC004722]